MTDYRYPDYGDRDDGYIFHLPNQYHASPYSGLLNVGAFYFKQDKWRRSDMLAKQRLSFWTWKATPGSKQAPVRPGFAAGVKNLLQRYPDGGMTWMQQGKGKLLFRHAPLGLGNTCGHGHADALSVLLYWDDMPLLIDLGSGQYNGDQNIRNYFRSTIAHNTIEIEHENQSKIIGPFMWDKSYRASLIESGSEPHLFAEAEHNGYFNKFALIHRRRIDWRKPENICITDSFLGKKRVKMRGAFHIGECLGVTKDKNRIIVKLNTEITLSILFPLDFRLEIYYGSRVPFLGWRSTIYGHWEPIHCIVFSTEINCLIRQYST